MKKGPVVPDIGVAGWRWSPEYGGMFAVCDNANLWLACDGPDAGMIGFYTERDWDDLRFRNPGDAMRAARRLQQAVAIWDAVLDGYLRVPANTTRPRTATGVPPMSLAEFCGDNMKFFADELKAALGRPASLYSVADDMLARHEREMDELGG